MRPEFKFYKNSMRLLQTNGLQDRKEHWHSDCSAVRESEVPHHTPHYRNGELITQRAILWTHTVGFNVPKAVPVKHTSIRYSTYLCTHKMLERFAKERPQPGTCCLFVTAALGNVGKNWPISWKLVRYSASPMSYFYISNSRRKYINLNYVIHVKRFLTTL